MTLQDLTNKLRGLCKEIEDLIDETGYLVDCELQGLDGYEGIRDADDLQRVEEYCNMFDRLLDFCQGVRFLDRPVKIVSKLQFYDDSFDDYYYEPVSGIKFRSGSSVEFLLRREVYVPALDAYMLIEVWMFDKISCNESGYFLENHPDVKLNGLTIRIREDVLHG